jgi:hypothetical protein
MPRYLVMQRCPAAPGAQQRPAPEQMQQMCAALLIAALEKAYRG